MRVASAPDLGALERPPGPPFKVQSDAERCSAWHGHAEDQHPQITLCGSPHVNDRCEMRGIKNSHKELLPSCELVSSEMARGGSGAYRSVYLQTLAQSGAFAHDHDMLEAMLTQTSLNKLLLLARARFLRSRSKFRGSVGGRPLSLILEARLIIPCCSQQLWLKAAQHSFGSHRRRSAWNGNDMTDTIYIHIPYTVSETPQKMRNSTSANRTCSNFFPWTRPTRCRGVQILLVRVAVQTVQTNTSCSLYLEGVAHLLFVAGDDPLFLRVFWHVFEPCRRLQQGRSEVIAGWSSLRFGGRG